MSRDRFVVGELDWSGGNHFAQERFVEAVNEVAPQVFSSLRENVLPHAYPHPTDAQKEEERRATVEWAESWNLNEEWMLHTAHSTLTLLLGDEEVDGLLYPGGDAHVMPSPDDFEFTTQFYMPFLQNRSAYKRRVLQEVEEYVERYMDEVEEQLAQEGELREPVVKQKQDDHFRWLVRYQVLETGFPTLADNVGRSRPTVTEGVKSTAELVGISLRPRGRGGRPSS